MTTPKTCEPYQPGDRPVPGYVLVEPLGRGGMGEVWKARSAGGVDVAMKVIDGLDQDAGLKEFQGLQVVKNIKHANLCPIVGFWLKDTDGNILDDSEHGAVSEEIGYLDDADEPVALKDTDRDSIEQTLRDPSNLRGTLLPTPMRETSGTRAAQLIIAMGLGHSSLVDRLEGFRAEGLDGVPVDMLLDYLVPSAKAIDLLNADYSIQHCDVKPGNILLVGDAPQVCDFGLAKQMSAHRRTTAAAFTVAYAPPELTDGKEPASTTDQYSLAITYYELRTGRLPYVEETYDAVMDAKNSGKLDFHGVGVREREILARATSWDPTKRYPTCADMMAALERAVHYVDQYRLLKWMASVAAIVVMGLGIAYVAKPQMFHELIASVLGIDDGRTGGGALDLEEQNRLLEIADTQFADGKMGEAFDTLDKILVDLPDHTGAIASRERFLSSMLESADTSLSTNAADAMAAFDRVAKNARKSDEAIADAAKLGWVRATVRTQTPDWETSDAHLAELQDRPSLTDNQKQQIAHLQILVATQGIAERVFEPKVLQRLAAIAELPVSEVGSWESDRVETLKFDALAAVEAGKIEVSTEDPLYDAIWPGGLELAFLLRSIQSGLAAEMPDHPAIRTELGRAELLAGGKTDAVTSRVAGLSRALRWSELLEKLRSGDEPLDSMLAEFERIGTDRPPVVRGDSIFAALNPYLDLQLSRDMIAPQQVARLREALAAGASWASPPVAAAWAQRLTRLDLVAGIIDPRLNLAESLDAVQQARSEAAADSIESVALSALEAECRLEADPDSWDAVAPTASALESESSAYQPYLGYIRTMIEKKKPLSRVSDSMAQRMVDLVAADPLPSFMNHETRRALAATILAEAAEARLRIDLNDLSLPATAPGVADTAHIYLESLRTVSSELPPNFDTLWTQAVYYGTRSARRVDEAIDATTRMIERDAAAVPARIMYIRAMVLRDRDGGDSWIEPLSRAIDIWADAKAPGPKQVMETILVPSLQVIAGGPPIDTPAKQRAVALLYGTAGRLVRENVGVEDLIRAGGDDPYVKLTDWFKSANEHAPEPVPEYLLGEAWGILALPTTATLERLDEALRLASAARELLPPMGARAVRLASSSESIRGLALIFKSRLQPNGQKRAEMLHDAVAAYQFACHPRNEDNLDYADFLGGLSAAHLELAFFGCGEHKWMNLTNAVRFAVKAKDRPERRRQEQAYLFLGNALEDQALYLNEDTYELSIEAFDTSRRIAEREQHGAAAAKAQFYLGRCLFRRVENDFSSDPTSDLDSALANLEAAEGSVEDAGQKAEIPIWISKVLNRQAADTVDESAAEQLYSRAEAALKRGIEVAAQQDDQYWARYQAELVKHYYRRRDTAASLAAAAEIIDAAKADHFGSKVSSTFILEAMRPTFSNAKNYDDIVTTVEQFLEYIPRTGSTNSRNRAEAYLARAEAMAVMESPARYWEGAEADAAEVLGLADDVHCEFDRLDLAYRAQAVVGTLAYRRYKDAFPNVTPQNADAAKAIAQRVVESLMMAIDSLDRRNEVASQALQRDLENEQLTEIEQSNREKYDRRIRDQDLAKSLDVRDRLAKTALSLCRDFDLGPDEVKQLARRVYQVTSEVSDRHVGSTPKRRRIWQELQAERRMLEELSKEE